MKKEWILLSATVLVTAALFLGLLRWLAPQLIGIPADLQMVQVSRELPPFFEGVFRDKDYAAQDLVLKDPYTNVRFRPLLPTSGGTGPHDILGFRNTGIPNSAGIITLGDSQTYGIGEPRENNWPSQLVSRLQRPGSTPLSLYNMAVGGWAAVQYLDMFPKALRLEPDIVIVAFYSGNDSLESFNMAYGTDHWKSLRPDSDLKGSDVPDPVPALSLEDSWEAVFSDGTRQRFMPGRRLVVNDTDYPAVRAGYAIMAGVARQIMDMAVQHDVTVVFTVIPTRELVYANKVASDALEAPERYRRLVLLEQQNIGELASAIRGIPGATYADLVQPMQRAAMSPAPLYPRQWDGHPGGEGYRIIASTLADSLASYYE